MSWWLLHWNSGGIVCLIRCPTPSSTFGTRREVSGWICCEEMLLSPREAVAGLFLSQGCQQTPPQPQFLNSCNHSHGFFWPFWECQQGRPMFPKRLLGPTPPSPTTFPSMGAPAAKPETSNRIKTGRKTAKISAYTQAVAIFLSLQVVSRHANLKKKKI